MPSEKTPFEDFGRKLDRGLGEAAKRMEQEGEKLIAYLNDEVVPSIRNNSSKALRVAAEKLSQLANYMEQKNSK
ncbi:MAG TPA: hypothetical protein VKE71_14865 [Candidatus Angelobacter sp.]|nr:hypothetical protein [Candidatus Angelobacter sp.]